MNYWTTIIRFIEGGIDDFELSAIIIPPIGSIIRRDENDGDWYVERIVTIISEHQTIIFVSDKPIRHKI